MATITAYIDEAFRGGPRGRYVMAAVLVAEDRAHDLRQDLRQLFGGRRRRFHWHTEATGPRDRMLEFIAEARLSTHSVTKGLSNLAQQERARAHCLERLEHVTL